LPHDFPFLPPYDCWLTVGGFSMTDDRIYILILLTEQIPAVLLHSPKELRQQRIDFHRLPLSSISNVFKTDGHHPDRSPHFPVLPPCPHSPDIIHDQVTWMQSIPVPDGEFPLFVAEWKITKHI
jgi:hypothetical protein